jgi:hypothetical protein
MFLNFCDKWYQVFYRVYQNSTAKLRELIPHIERWKEGYDNMGPEMYGYRVVRACIYWVHADTSWLRDTGYNCYTSNQVPNKFDVGVNTSKVRAHDILSSPVKPLKPSGYYIYHMI